MLRYAMLCYIMQCHVMLCCAMLDAGGTGEPSMQSDAIAKNSIMPTAGQQPPTVAVPEQNSTSNKGTSGLHDCMALALSLLLVAVTKL